MEQTPEDGQAVGTLPSLDGQTRDSSPTALAKRGVAEGPGKQGTSMTLEGHPLSGFWFPPASQVH